MTRFKRRDFLKTAAGVAITPLPLLDLVNAFLISSPPVARPKVFDQFDVATSINVEDVLRAISQPTAGITLSSTAHPDRTIKPGQPISLRWGVYDWASYRAGGGGFSEDRRYASAQATILFNGNPIFGPSRSRTASIFLTDHGPDLARNFYTIGNTNELTIEVTNTPDGGTYTGRVELEVVRDNAPSWEWTTPSTVIGWKDHFTLSGILHNNAEFAIMNVLPTLHLDSPGGHPDISPQDFPLTANREIAIQHASALSLTSADFTQDWQWFDQLFLIQNGSLTREFPYSVHYSAIDEFRNSYGNPASDSLPISISVSREKRLEFAAASAGQIAAAIISALAVAALAGGYTAVGAPFLFAAAGVLESGSRLAQAAANDPPEPDSRFMESVNVSPEALPDMSVEPKAYNNLPLFGVLAKRILNSRLALYQIEGRILGARKAQSSEGLDLQTGDYAKLLYAMITDTEALLKVLPEVLQLVKSDSGFDAKIIQNGLDSLRKGIPVDVRSGWEKAGIPKDDQISLEKVVQNQDVMKQAADVPAVLERIAHSLAEVTVIVRSQAPGVLLPYGTEQDGKKNGKGEAKGPTAVVSPGIYQQGKDGKDLKQDEKQQVEKQRKDEQLKVDDSQKKDEPSK